MNLLEKMQSKELNNIENLKNNQKISVEFEFQLVCEKRNILNCLSNDKGLFTAHVVSLDFERSFICIQEKYNGCEYCGHCNFEERDLNITRSHVYVYNLIKKDYNKSAIIPEFLNESCIKISTDVGNIELSSYPTETYAENVKNIQTTLEEFLIPKLGKLLNKFALFLPAIYCDLVIPKWLENTGDEERFNKSIKCTKHINLNGLFKPNIDLMNNLLLKNYVITMKDSYLKQDFYETNRIEIKVPYWFIPPKELENYDKWPNFNELKPVNGWKPLIGYYKNNTWIKVRGLI